MKKLILSLLAVLLTVNSFGQLNESTVGEFHNQKMDKYYSLLQNLASSKEKSLITKNDFYVAFTNLTMDTFGTNNPDLMSNTNAEFLKYLDFTFNQQVDSSIQKIANVTTTSEELKTFLISAINHCRNKSNNQENIRYLQIKLNEARLKFSGTELQIVEVSFNTGISSFAYWDGNYNKWDNVFGTTSASRKPPVNVGVADLAGATVGALYGAVGGTAFLPGVGTVAGAVAVGVAGGLYSSTVAAVTNLYSYFF